MANSNLLLITNFPNQESSGIIPGKLFEYLSTGNRILSLGYKPSAVENILSETSAGQHFSYEEENKIKEFLHQQFSDFLSNPTKEKEKLSEKILSYSRKNLTKKLSDLLYEYTSSR